MKLSEIQQKIRATKDQRNEFGGYAYRTAEGILATVKPLLGDAHLILSDEVVEIAGRVYVKAIATITIDGETHSSSAYAREQADKKGMDQAQVTGAASSYARKYALCGLLAIDDGSFDPDAQNNQDEGDPSARRQAFIDNVQAKHEKLIVRTKEAIAAGDYAPVAPDILELANLTQSEDDALRSEARVLFLPPSKGGCFTTDELKIIKNDFRKAIA